MSFIEDQKIIDKLEKVSKKQKISQGPLIRALREVGLRGWDC